MHHFDKTREFGAFYPKISKVSKCCVLIFAINPIIFSNYKNFNWIGLTNVALYLSYHFSIGFPLLHCSISICSHSRCFKFRKTIFTFSTHNRLYFIRINNFANYLYTLCFC